MGFERFLKDVPIIENEDFKLYGDNDLESVKLELLDYFSLEKRRLLDFFKLTSFDIVSINLFNTQEGYLKFSRQFFNPTSYSRGNFANGEINLVYSIEKYESLKKLVIHELSHLLYQKLRCKNYDRILWFDEGLALYLAGQYNFLENNYDTFKKWYLDRIVSKNKEIPNISFLKQHGNKYGQFVDMETNKYNGYDLSYLIVRYLVCCYKDFHSLLTDNDKIYHLEGDLLNRCITYYNNYFDVNEEVCWNNRIIRKSVYHGSPNGDIDWLVAKESTHQQKCIYATDDKTVALLFMGKGNGDLDTRISTVDGVLELVERRDGVLEKLYNHDGYLYELDGSTFFHYDYLWSLEVISFEEKIKPLKRVYCENVLTAILEEEKKGNIKIYHYPNRPSCIPLDNSDLIDKFIEFENQGLHGCLNHMLSIYPEFNQEVSRRLCCNDLANTKKLK